MSGFVASIHLAVLALLLPLQQQLPDLFPKNEQTLHGRIVLYDWYARGSTSGDDFIVKTTDSRQPYVRIAYKPFWGFDAPPSRPEDKLDKRAFTGAGRWSFTVHLPMSFEEKGGCSSVQTIYREVDEHEHLIKELPRYRPTPAAAGEKAPSFETLPCFILKRAGLRPEHKTKH